MRGELCSMRLNKSSILKTGHHLFPEASAQAEPHLATIAKRFSALTPNGRYIRADECLFSRVIRTSSRHGRMTGSDLAVVGWTQFPQRSNAPGVPLGVLSSGCKHSGVGSSRVDSERFRSAPKDMPQAHWYVCAGREPCPIAAAG